MVCRSNSIRIIGNKPTGMATLTTTTDARMYSSHECRRCKTTSIRVIVTDTAFIQCRDMIIRLAYGANQDMIGIAIMAGFTFVSNTRVSKVLCWFERGSGNVAHITILVRRYMFDRLSSADATIMAGCAIAGIDTHVVKCRISKVRGAMTYGAICCGWQVIYVFTITDHLVVTGFTVINNTGVIIAAGGKGARGVTNTTIFRGWHVVERFTARTNTMAGCAIVHDVRMIDECTRETLGVMARSTIGRGSRVGGHRRCFSGCVNTIAIVVA